MASRARRGIGRALAGMLSCAMPATAAMALDAPQAEAGVVDLPLPDGAVQRLLYRSPDAPVAALILLTGGDGVLGIEGDGRIRRGGNFLVRTREQWLARGFAVAIPDVPSDRTNLLGVRLSRGYGEVLRRIVEHVRTRTPAPIWLVGTSQGSIAAANGAGRLTGGEIAGAVLTSSLSRPSSRVTDTVFGADLDRVIVPVLIASHRGDGCRLTPPADAEAIRRALTRSPRTEVMLFDGGLPARSEPCEAFSEHGFLGIEAQVLDRVAAWIKAP